MKRHIPNFITCLNLLTGALGCIEILTGDYKIAIIYVAIAGVFDFFDGFAARMLQVKSDIGKELDSLADMVSFGLLPGLFMVKMIETQDAGIVRYAGLLVVVFSALRLAKFNIDTRQSEEFIGVPTPANTILLTSLVFLPFEPGFIALLVLTLLSCFLLVSPFHLIALKFKSFGWKGNEFRFAIIFISVGLLAWFQEGGVPFIIPTYIILSIARNLFGAKSIS